jgi:hypothetical protein
MSWQGWATEGTVFIIFGFIVTWGGTYVINLIRAPGILYGEQHKTIIDHVREIKRLKTKLVSASSPTVSQFEQEQRRAVREKLQQAGDDKSLRYLLLHGDTEDGELRSALDFKGIVRLKKVGLVQDQLRGPHGQERYWFINPRFVDALKYVLYEEQSKS